MARFIIQAALTGALIASLCGHALAQKNEATEVGGGTHGQNNGSTQGVSAKANVVPLGASQHWINTEDGYRVAAWYWAPLKPGSPGVILAHMRGSDKSSFAGLAIKLVEEGFAALAIDLRGHGVTIDPEGLQGNYENFSDSDYLAMLKDISAAHAFLDSLAEVNGDRVAIIGASIGANLGIIYAAGDRRVRTVVALSPGLNYRSLKPVDYLEDYGQRALYLVTSKQDAYSYQSCQALVQAAKKADPVSIRAFDGMDHGTDLLASHPGLDMTIITGWLYNHLPPNN